MRNLTKIIFWQNIISPHQIDFLRELSAVYNVTLIVDETQDKYRKNDGWEIPEYSFMQIYIQPNSDIVNSLFADNESVHVFSGIGAYTFVDKGFKKAIAVNARIGILSEPIQMKGIKGFLKLVKGNLQRLIYSNKIDFICATGNMGVDTYLKYGYKPEKIFQWGYFVERIKTGNVEREKTIVYVGQLIKRKYIKQFAELFSSNNGLGYETLNIIGKGPLKSELDLIVENNNNICKINLLGRLSSKETFDRISKSSLLVIPSEFDGWAVVVNESLLCGTPVVASSSVGAGVLLDGKLRGEVFENRNMDSLKEIIEIRSLTKMNLIESSEIINWAENNISPKVAVQYFSKIIKYTYCNARKKPIAPWLK